ncbi:hypothetical protein E2320_022987, partial [Naja naja]
ELPKGLSDDYKTLMMNSSLGDLNATQNYYEYNNINDSYEYEDGIIPSDLGWNVWMSISLVICCIGFVGNGYIIWLLSFQIKRNHFTTFILHLAIADNGFLASIVLYDLHQFTYFLGSGIFYHFFAFFSHMMYINANFLLTAISIDRCVAVLFPIWHHCFRPKGLSSMLCVVLWISSFLLSGSMSIVLFTDVFGAYSLYGLHFLVTAIVSLPFITLSTLVLFIKVCVQPKKKNRGRLLLMILMTLLCYLILAFPLNVFVVILNFFSIQTGPDLPYWEAGVILFSCLNSSINPLGEKKRSSDQRKHEGPFAKVCVLLWISSSLLSGIMSIRKGFVNYILLNFHFLVAATICLLLITLSTMVLFIKVCLKSNQKNQGRLLLMILITLLCFLILAFPLCVFAVIISFSSTNLDNKLQDWTVSSIMFSCINSSVNPVIYFLVGSKKGEHESHFAKGLQRSGSDWREIEEFKPTYKTSVLPTE